MNETRSNCHSFNFLQFKWLIDGQIGAIKRAPRQKAYLIRSSALLAFGLNERRRRRRRPFNEVFKSKQYQEKSIHNQMVICLNRNKLQ